MKKLYINPEIEVVKVAMQLLLPASQLDFIKDDTDPTKDKEVDNFDDLL